MEATANTSYLPLASAAAVSSKNKFGNAQDRWPETNTTAHPSIPESRFLRLTEEDDMSWSRTNFRKAQLAPSMEVAVEPRLGSGVSAISLHMYDDLKDVPAFSGMEATITKLVEAATNSLREEVSHLRSELDGVKTELHETRASLLAKDTLLQEQVRVLQVGLYRALPKYASPSYTRVTEVTKHVASVYELRHNILRYLPFHSLLRCQRVNKAFKETIDGSHYLQRALFKLPKTCAQSASTGIAFNYALYNRGLKNILMPFHYLGPGCTIRVEFSKSVNAGIAHYTTLSFKFDNASAAAAFPVDKTNHSSLDMYLTQPPTTVTIKVSYRKTSCEAGGLCYHKHAIKEVEVRVAMRASKFGEMIEVAKAVIASDVDALVAIRNNHAHTPIPACCPIRDMFDMLYPNIKRFDTPQEKALLREAYVKAGGLWAAMR